MNTPSGTPSALNGSSRAQYRDYRRFVIARLPLLQCLEDLPVSASEREQSLAQYGPSSSAPSGVDRVLGRKRKPKKSSRPSVSADAPEHPYARRQELPIPGRSQDPDDEWTTDSEDIDMWAGYVPVAKTAPLS